MTAHIADTARVYGSALVYGSAQVYDSARVYGTAQVGGTGDIATQGHVAWVDRVGSGHSMTLHRVRLDDGYGWRINAGCVHFEAATVEEVCNMVLANVANGPAEWADAPSETRLRWATQVDAALGYLTAMVEP